MSAWEQNLAASSVEDYDTGYIQEDEHNVDVTSTEYIIDMMAELMDNRRFWDKGKNIEKIFLTTHYAAEVLDKVIKLCKEGENFFSNSVIALIYSHPDVSQEVLLQGAYDSRWIVRAAVATHPLLPVELQEKLATDIVSDVREKVAENPNLDTNVYAILAEDNFFGTIYNLWQNTENQTVELELKLSSFFIPNDPSDHNPVPSFTKNPETLYILCSHEDKRVREDAAKNPYCPEDGIIIARLLG